MQNKIITTEDGSHTIYVPQLDEHYHSTHGAVNESMHIYIHAGLKHQQKQKLNLLEIGFGTGLNTFLTLAISRQEKRKVNYFSIEKYPLSAGEYEKLNYPALIFPEQAGYFTALHEAEWNTECRITNDFQLKKIQADLKTFDFEGLPSFDLIYFDAFAPGKQPEMWTPEIFGKIAQRTNHGGVFVTYCAKGEVRRILNSFGFQMERLPGPVGKKEILRGTKQS